MQVNWGVAGGREDSIVFLAFLLNLHYQTTRNIINVELYYQTTLLIASNCFNARETICYSVYDTRCKEVEYKNTNVSVHYMHVLAVG